MVNNKKVISAPVKFFDETLLECVSGGKNDDAVTAAGWFTTLGSAPVFLGCMTAGVICKHKGKKFMKKGDTAKSEKFQKASRILTDVSAGVGAVGTVGVMVFLYNL